MANTSNAQTQSPQIANAGKSLAIESIRLKAAPGSLVAGKSAANALIQIYNGQTLIGSTLANADGAWSVSMGQRLEPGKYTVRIVASDPKSGAKQTRNSETYIVTSSGIARKKQDQNIGATVSDAKTMQKSLERRADQLGLLASERFERFLSKFGIRQTTNTASNTPSNEAASKSANSTTDTKRTKKSSSTNAVGSAPKKANGAANRVAKVAPSKTNEQNAVAAEGSKSEPSKAQSESASEGGKSSSQRANPTKSNTQTTDTATSSPSTEKSPAVGGKSKGSDGDERVANIMKSATDRLKKLLGTTPNEGDGKKQAAETPNSKTPTKILKDETPKRVVLGKPKHESGNTANSSTNADSKKSIPAAISNGNKQSTASISGTNTESGKLALNQPQVPALPVRRSLTDYQKQKTLPTTPIENVQENKAGAGPSQKKTTEGKKTALKKPQTRTVETRSDSQKPKAKPARPAKPVADSKKTQVAAAPGNEKDEAAKPPKREKPKVGRIPARLAKARLRVGDIDYEIAQSGRGRISASGKGRPGATVSARVGGKTIASSTVNDNGRWRLRVRRKLNRGTTKVILRMNDPATGYVQNARFEFETEPDAETRRPRRRATSPRRQQTVTYDQLLRDTHIRTAPDTFSSSNEAGVYVVRPGDTLQSIAGRVYGDRGQWHALMRANRGRIDHPNQIYSGQVLRLN